MKKLFKQFSKQNFKYKHTTSIDAPRAIIKQNKGISFSATDIGGFGEIGAPLDPDNLVFGRKCTFATFLTMNNPRNYNRFDLRFCKAVKTQIERYNYSPLVKFIILRGGGSRSFSDGIDIFEIFESVQNNDKVLPIRLFREMYKTSYYISNISTPLITYINGSMTGGGSGIGAYSDYVLVNEGSTYSVPECSYGFFPDNANCYLLSKINEKHPGLGTFLALTGAEVKGKDLIHVGLATHYGYEKAVWHALTGLENLEVQEHSKVFMHDQLMRFIGKPDPQERLSFERDLKPIQRCFTNKNRMEEVVEALKLEDSEWSRNILEAFSSMSPTSLQVTLRAMNEAQGSEMDTVYRNDYRISLRMIYTNDFKEGLSKVLLQEPTEKELPKWVPETLEKVTDEYIDSFFKPLNLEENLTCDLNIPDEAFMGQAMEIELKRKNIKI